eukprot:m.271108 g.271108  ORF g.271108 m.271108 type:complete len:820 (+) comp26865_c0_seq1:66-2525(+)
MVLVAFVLDTSGSMNQRTSNGTTYLDRAKGAIEQFIKFRGRAANHRVPDRFMLFSYAPGLSSVKVDLWHPGHSRLQPFFDELQQVTAVDVSRPGETLKTAFEIINMYRLQNKIDSFGQGRNPSFNEPTAVIVLTNGSGVVTTDGLTTTLSVPLGNKPGSELVREPFRWDQRVFAITLRMSGGADKSSGPPSPFAPMCEVTGGKSFVASSSKSLMQCIESINSKLLYPGVVVSFKALPRVASAADGVVAVMPSAPHKHIKVQREKGNNSIGYWPIPESYWPGAHDQMQPRDAHPVILVKQEAVEPQVVENMPFDKYELESCELTQHILTLKRNHNPNICFQCFIQNSHSQEGPGKPFGYLKPSSSGQRVNLVVLPYDYPTLITLLQGLVKFPVNPPSKEWGQRFERYLTSSPPYYVRLLRDALRQMHGAQGASLISDQFTGNLRGSYQAYIAKLDSISKAESQKISDRVVKARDKMMEEGAAYSSRAEARNSGGRSSSRGVSPFPAADPSAQTTNGAGKAPAAGGVTAAAGGADAAAVFTTPSRDILGGISRKDLLVELARLRENLRRALKPRIGAGLLDAEDAKHSVPISTMGNFQEIIKKREVMRDAKGDDHPIPVSLGKNKGRVISHGVDEFEERLTQEADPELQSSGRRKRQRSETARPRSGTFGRTPNPNESDPKRRSASLPPTLGNSGPDVQPPTPVAVAVAASASSTPSPVAIPAAASSTAMAVDVPAGAALPLPDSDALGKAALRTLKSKCNKEIRKPGKKYEAIIAMVGSVKNDGERRGLIDDLVKECARYRMADLIGLLEKERDHTPAVV